jgi:CheY-like chemotaxis protein
MSKVLVVEDDPALCELIREVLHSSEMETHALTDSTQAAARLRKEKFDAAFLDLHMPPPDGIELARQMRASSVNRRTLIVMISGHDDRTLLTRAFDAGANFFLFKPLDRQILLRLIRVTQGPIEGERRRHTRLKFQCKVSVEWAQEILNGTTLDLSLGGLLVQARRVLPVGSRVRINLELTPGKPPLRLAARVVRVAGNDCMGLQVEDASTVEKKRFQEFLLPLVLAVTNEKSPAGSAKSA